jgi:hypothetical protein
MRIQVATVRHVAESKERGREGGRDSSLRQNNNAREQWSLSEFRRCANERRGASGRQISRWAKKSCSSNLLPIRCEGEYFW